MLAQFACRLRILRGPRGGCMAQVRVSVAYADLAGLHRDPPPDLQRWTAAHKATHLKLLLLPRPVRFGDGEVVPCAELLFSVAAAAVLVGGPRGPPMDLDGVLAGGDRGAVTRLARGLARCISLECCGPPDSAEGGERFSWVVGGAFSEPPRVSFPWPQGQT
mmetsp:Transcript_25802/g.35478  ORF Transcript_25802/g.35478 Transcript_25802/m.35478 type:complete len:162 (+) Transcript_25802:234-719(+)